MMQRAIEILREHFGYESFRARQAEIIAHVAAGRHAMVVMPTGGGKSLCFQIPALMATSGDGDLTLVLSPLVALMQDQVDSLRARGVDPIIAERKVTRSYARCLLLIPLVVGVAAGHEVADQVANFLRIEPIEQFERHLRNR